MNTITLQTIQSASFKDLKAFALANGIQIDGDRRKKANYINSIEAYLVECGDLEAIAMQADIENADVSLHELEESQEILKAIVPSATVTNYATSPTEQPEISEVEQEVANSSEVGKPVNANFREGSALVFLMQPLAMFLGAFIVASVWLTIQSGIALKPVIAFILRQLDRGLTGILKGLVMVIEYLFGDTDINEYSQGMQELIHLI